MDVSVAEASLLPRRYVDQGKRKDFSTPFVSVLQFYAYHRRGIGNEVNAKPIGVAIEFREPIGVKPL